MICRIWHGFTSVVDADAYEHIVRGQVIPGIEAMSIPGFRHIDLVRRPVEGGFEYMTIMWFSDLDAIHRFVGEDPEISHVPAVARAVLARFDQRATHYEVLDRRPQPGDALSP
jgi:heme-degrading monooxygenase HmoA